MPTGILQQKIKCRWEELQYFRLLTFRHLSYRTAFSASISPSTPIINQLSFINTEHQSPVHHQHRPSITWTWLLQDPRCVVSQTEMSPFSHHWIHLHHLSHSQNVEPCHQFYTEDGDQHGAPRFRLRAVDWCPKDLETLAYRTAITNLQWRFPVINTYLLQKQESMHHLQKWYMGNHSLYLQNFSFPTNTMLTSSSFAACHHIHPSQTNL